MKWVCSVLNTEEVYRLLMAACEGNMYTQLRITFHLCPKKTKWRTEFSEGFACPIPLQWADFAGSGQVISGRLANRFGSRFGKNKKLLCGVSGHLSTPNDYL